MVRLLRTPWTRCLALPDDVRSIREGFCPVLDTVHIDLKIRFLWLVIPQNPFLSTQLSTHGHPRPKLDSTKGKKHGIKDYKIALIFLVHFPDADSRFG